MCGVSTDAYGDMKFDIIDISVVAAIFVCAYYVWDDKRSTTYLLVEEFVSDCDEGEFESDAELALENTAHPARNCDACGSKGSVIVLEVTYSGLRPLTTEKANILGDELLEGLFMVRCACLLLRIVYPSQILAVQ